MLCAGLFLPPLTVHFYGIALGGSRMVSIMIVTDTCPCLFSRCTTRIDIFGFAVFSAWSFCQSFIQEIYNRCSEVRADPTLTVAPGGQPACLPPSTACIIRGTVTYSLHRAVYAELGLLVIFWHLVLCSILYILWENYTKILILWWFDLIFLFGWTNTYLGGLACTSKLSTKQGLNTPQDFP